MRLRVKLMEVHQVYLHTGHKKRGTSNSAFKVYKILHAQQEENINFVGI
jgi:hypothetical protein